MAVCPTYSHVSTRLKPIQGADWYPWLHILVHRHHMLANGLESAGNVGCESNWPWIRMSSKVTHELSWDENNQHGKSFATIACRSTWNQSSNQIKPGLLTFQKKVVFKVNLVPLTHFEKPCEIIYITTRNWSLFYNFLIHLSGKHPIKFIFSICFPWYADGFPPLLPAIFGRNSAPRGNGRVDLVWVFIIRSHRCRGRHLAGVT